MAPLPSHLAHELDLPHPLRRGASGSDVRHVQEWLSLNAPDLAVAIDGDFGPATERAVQAFQHDLGLADDGIVTPALFARLNAALRHALQPPAAPPTPGLYGAWVRRIAAQHLTQSPREIGGANRGPWVRAYTGGHEGRDWPWCAGFVSFVLHQAAHASGLHIPLNGSVSCDRLAQQALSAGRFINGRQTRPEPSAESCCIFLCRRTDDDWTHTGFAFDFNGESFRTIEGNTNDEGCAEGYEACSRIRGMAGKDFIRLD